MKRACIAIYLFLAITASGDDRALSPAQAARIALTPQQQLDIEKAALNKRRFDASQDFKGLKLGLGFAITQNIGDTRIETAEVIDEKVRVTEERNTGVHAVGEIHRFTSKDTGTCTEDDASGCARWGHGPFFSLQTGNNDVIEAAGIGYMIGFRQNEDKAQSLNIGLGIVADPSVKVLGDDVKENQKPPGAEKTARLKKTSGWSIGIVVSFGF
jgi:hypothetical protein